jgi:hypothetical protein
MINSILLFITWCLTIASTSAFFCNLFTDIMWLIFTYHICQSKRASMSQPESATKRDVLRGFDDGAEIFHSTLTSVGKGKASLA